MLSSLRNISQPCPSRTQIPAKSAISVVGLDSEEVDVVVWERAGIDGKSARRQAYCRDGLFHNIRAKRVLGYNTENEIEGCDEGSGAWVVLSVGVFGGTG